MFTWLNNNLYYYIPLYDIVTCYNRAQEVSKCRFALITRSISAGQKSCIAVNTGILPCFGTFLCRHNS